MNYIVQLHTNDTRNISSPQMVLHSEIVELLEFGIKNYEGFTRFQMDILDETEKENNVVGVNNWLNENVFFKEDQKIFYRELWTLLGEALINEDGELDEGFLDFERGVDIEYVWHWFEETFNISVGEEFFK